MWLTEEERKRTSPAEKADFVSPVPTQIVSNGEYNPMPQTEQQKQVESRIKEMADQYAHRLNMDRRTFLKTASGMAVAFLAMNEVFGPVWNVTEAEAAEPEVSDARAKALKKQFIFDDQTHFVRDDFDKEGLLGLGKYASEHWNPDMLKDIPLVLQRYKFQNYLKEIFLDSDTKVAVLTGAPFDDPDWWLLSNDQIKQARDAINKVAGSRRLMSHAVITPNQPGWMDEVDRSIAELKPDTWKCYTIGDPLSPSTKGTAWRLDDEKLVYPWYEKAMKSGIRNIAIHKGLLPLDYETSWPGVWKHATPDDVLKAAKDWPDLNFIIYHGAMRNFLEDPKHTLDKFEKTGRIDWTTDVCELSSKHGCKNVYAELGTTFATVAVASPRLAAAMIGQMVNQMGADHVVWGTDSVWYGSPQWQIEAFRRLEVPEDIMKKFGWKTALGAADGKVKTQIFGQNSAKLYKYQIQ
ncbi:MAG TPA: amidohydrolase family protein, partial [Burkholderiales bacterium]|nr:amidohydrolase family protein [Burkholderiales bacterium]